jgi:DNA-binding transcriptional regulator YdaS (Cro superfamily)
MEQITIHELLEKRGACTAIAKECGISTAAVSKWPKVPAERVLAVERATGISRHRLRPDVYPEDGSALVSWQPPGDK